MTRPLLYADQILDANHDGLLSIREVEAIVATPGENLHTLLSGRASWRRTIRPTRSIGTGVITSDPRATSSRVS